MISEARKSYYFEYLFTPKSEEESITVADIIGSFRKGSYPVVATGLPERSYPQRLWNISVLRNSNGQSGNGSYDGNRTADWFGEPLPCVLSGVVVKHADYGDPIVRFLDEVRINEYKNINAVSLRIISPNTKHYSPAERKLKSAEELHWYSPLLIPFGGMSVDGLINSISGRTSILKKELEVEKKELLIHKLEGWFEKKYFIENLKIPEEYVKGFLFYLVEDPKFTAAMKSQNKTMATFIMNDLAVKYNQLLKDK
jgi:hypothetical protein